MEANDYLIGLERTESAFPTYYTQGAREKAHQLSEITEKRARFNYSPDSVSGGAEDKAIARMMRLMPKILWVKREDKDITRTTISMTK